jgi:hypothetical protein
LKKEIGKKKTQSDEELNIKRNEKSCQTVLTLKSLKGKSPKLNS